MRRAKSGMILVSILVTALPYFSYHLCSTNLWGPWGLAPPSSKNPHYQTKDQMQNRHLLVLNEWMSEWMNALLFDCTQWDSILRIAERVVNSKMLAKRFLVPWRWRKRRDAQEGGMRGSLIASLSGSIWTNQPGTQIATDVLTAPRNANTICMPFVRRPCRLWRAESLSIVPGPGQVHRTERHSRVEEPETDVNTQSGCVGAASVALAGWGLFSSAVGHSTSCFSTLDSNALLSACGVYQHLCLPEHSSNVAVWVWGTCKGQGTSYPWTRTS